jgi:hypothetical protein
MLPVRHADNRVSPLEEARLRKKKKKKKKLTQFDSLRDELHTNHPPINHDFQNE